MYMEVAMVRALIAYCFILCVLQSVTKAQETGSTIAGSNTSNGSYYGSYSSTPNYGYNSQDYYTLRRAEDGALLVNATDTPDIWRVICADGWDNQDATVVCREWGFDSGDAFALPNTNSLSPAATHVSCYGYEWQGRDCSYQKLNITDNCNGMIAGVNCSYSSYSSSPSYGSANKKFFTARINFTDMAYAGDLGDPNSAAFMNLSSILEPIVKDLIEQQTYSYGTVEVNATSYSPGSLIVEFKISVDANIADSQLFNILYYALQSGWLGYHRVSLDSFYLTSHGSSPDGYPVALGDSTGYYGSYGTTSNYGYNSQDYYTLRRGEDGAVLVNATDTPDIWRVICADGWDNQDATVVCREWGFDSGDAFALPDTNSLSPAATHVSCYGYEWQGRDCTYQKLNITDNCNGMIAGVNCSYSSYSSSPSYGSANKRFFTVRMNFTDMIYTGELSDPNSAAFLNLSSILEPIVKNLIEQQTYSSGTVAVEARGFSSGSLIVEFRFSADASIAESQLFDIFFYALQSGWLGNHRVSLESFLFTSLGTSPDGSPVELGDSRGYYGSYGTTSNYGYNSQDYYTLRRGEDGAMLVNATDTPDRWRVICADGWDYQDATVVCREWGFDSGDAFVLPNTNSLSPAATHVNCYGYEWQGRDCSYQKLNTTDNCNGMIAGVNCSYSSYSSSPSYGSANKRFFTVRMNFTDMIYTGELSDPNSAAFLNLSSILEPIVKNLIEQQTYSSGTVAVEARGYSSGSLIVEFRFSADASIAESQLFDIFFYALQSGWLGNHRVSLESFLFTSLGTSPDGSPVELGDSRGYYGSYGTTSNYGYNSQDYYTLRRGEDGAVLVNATDTPDIWRVICADGWDNQDATVVCREWGFDSGDAFALPDTNSLSPAATHVSCYGYEWQGRDCTYQKLNITDNCNGMIAGVNCSYSSYSSSPSYGSANKRFFTVRMNFTDMIYTGELSDPNSAAFLNLSSILEPIVKDLIEQQTYSSGTVAVEARGFSSGSLIVEFRFSADASIAESQLFDIFFYALQSGWLGNHRVSLESFLFTSLGTSPDGSPVELGDSRGYYGSYGTTSNYGYNSQDYYTLRRGEDGAVLVNATDTPDIWRVICADGWDYQDATVVCREWGFDSGDAFALLNTNSLFPAATHVSCYGYEWQGRDCTYQKLNITDNCNGMIAGVNCSYSSYSSSPSYGSANKRFFTVRMNFTDMIYTGELSDPNSAAFLNLSSILEPIVKNLIEQHTYSSGTVAVEARGYSSGSLIVEFRFSADASIAESQLFDIFFYALQSGWLGNHRVSLESFLFTSLGTSPDGSPVELGDSRGYYGSYGTTSNYGYNSQDYYTLRRGEDGAVLVNATDTPDIWRVICADGWDNQDATVVCREWGFDSGDAFALPDTNSLSPAATHVSCYGYEWQGRDCTYQKLNITDNCNGMIAGVNCSYSSYSSSPSYGSANKRFFTVRMNFTDMIYTGELSDPNSAAFLNLSSILEPIVKNLIEQQTYSSGTVAVEARGYSSGSLIVEFRFSADASIAESQLFDIFFYALQSGWLGNHRVSLESFLFTSLGTSPDGSPVELGDSRGYYGSYGTTSNYGYNSQDYYTLRRGEDGALLVNATDTPDRWRVICADGWDNQDATVVCREWGFDSGDAFALPNTNSLSPAATHVNCYGYEWQGRDCSYQKLNTTDNCNGMIAGVNCSYSSYSSSPSYGSANKRFFTVRMNFTDMIYTGELSDPNSAAFLNLSSILEPIVKNLIEQQTYSSGTVAVEARGYSSGSLIVEFRFSADASIAESQLFDIFFYALQSGWLGNHRVSLESFLFTSLGTSPDGSPVELGDSRGYYGSYGTTSNYGYNSQDYYTLRRGEDGAVLVNATDTPDIWRVICADGWDYQDATVVCREWGFDSGDAFALPNTNSLFPAATHVSCYGYEWQGRDCTYQKLNITDNCNGMIAGVNCSYSSYSSSPSYGSANKRFFTVRMNFTDMIYTGELSDPNSAAFLNLSSILEPIVKNLIEQQTYSSGTVAVEARGYSSGSLIVEFRFSVDASIAESQLFDIFFYALQSGWLGNHRVSLNSLLFASLGSSPDGNPVVLGDSTGFLGSYTTTPNYGYDNQGYAFELGSNGEILFRGSDTSVPLREICADGGWNDVIARVLCREMDFSDGVALTLPQTSVNSKVIGIDCYAYDSQVQNCNVSEVNNCPSGQITALNCTGSMGSDAVTPTYSYPPGDMASDAVTPIHSYPPGDMASDAVTPTHSYPPGDMGSDTVTPTHSYPPGDMGSDAVTPTHSYPPGDMGSDAVTPTHSYPPGDMGSDAVTPTHSYPPGDMGSDAVTPTHSYPSGDMGSDAVTPTHSYQPGDMGSDAVTPTHSYPPGDMGSDAVTPTHSYPPGDMGSDAVTPTHSYPPSDMGSDADTPTPSYPPGDMGSDAVTPTYSYQPGYTGTDALGPSQSDTPEPIFFTSYMFMGPDAVGPSYSYTPASWTVTTTVSTPAIAPSSATTFASAGTTIVSTTTMSMSTPPMAPSSTTTFTSSGTTSANTGTTSMSTPTMAPSSTTTFTSSGTTSPNTGTTSMSTPTMAPSSTSTFTSSGTTTASGGATTMSTPAMAPSSTTTFTSSGIPTASTTPTSMSTPPMAPSSTTTFTSSGTTSANTETTSMSTPTMAPSSTTTFTSSGTTSANTGTTSMSTPTMAPSSTTTFSSSGTTSANTGTTSMSTPTMAPSSTSTFTSSGTTTASGGATTMSTPAMAPSSTTTFTSSGIPTASTAPTSVSTQAIAPSSTTTITASDSTTTSTSVTITTTTTTSTTTTPIPALTAANYQVSKAAGGTVVLYDGTVNKTICRDSAWDSNGARVVCNQLGYYGGETKIVPSSGYDTIASNMACSGTESSIFQCSSSSPGTCPAGNDAGVDCYGYRLRSDPDGRVRVEHANSAVEGSVCAAGWQDADVSVTCREWGRYGGTRYALPRSTYTRTMANLGCNGQEASIRDCTKTVDKAGVTCSSQYDAALTCYPSCSAWAARTCNDRDYKMLLIEDLEDGAVIPALTVYGCTGNCVATHTSSCDSFSCAESNTRYFALVADGMTDRTLAILGMIPGFDMVIVSWFTRKTRDMLSFNRGNSYTMNFNGAPPQHVRYTLLNAGPNDKMKLVATYPPSAAENLEVYYNDIYTDRGSSNLDPTNALTTPGDSFLDYTQHSIIIGEYPVEVYVAKVCKFEFVIIVDVDFEVLRLRLLVYFELTFKISRDYISVSFSYGVIPFRRRLLSGTEATYTVEIGNQACDNSTGNCTTTSTAPSSSNSTSVPSYTTLQDVASDVVNQYQSGNLSSVLNVTVNGMGVTEAIPPSTDDLWGQILNNTADVSAVLKIPDTLVISTQPVPGKEGKVFTTQPCVHTLDNTGVHVPALGITSNPWRLQVTIQEHSNNATLSGTTTIPFTSGWANFTDLAISAAGSGYVLTFRIIEGTSLDFTTNSNSLTVSQRSLSTTVVSTGDGSSRITESVAFPMVVDVRDADTNQVETDLAGYTGYQWHANITQITIDTYNGTLGSSYSYNFDTSTGQMTIQNITLSSPGMALISVTVYTTPSKFSMTTSNTKVLVYSSQQASVVVTVTKTIVLRFDLDYNTYGNDEFAAMMYTYLSNLFQTALITDITISEGSVLVTATIGGSSSSVDSVLSGVCSTITSGTSMTYKGQSVSLSNYLTVDGESYYDQGCINSTSTSDTSSSQKTGLIVGIICGVIGMIAIGVIIAYILWKYKFSRMKGHKLRDEERHHIASTTIEGDRYYVKGNFWTDPFDTDDTKKNPLHFRPSSAVSDSSLPIKISIKSAATTRDTLRPDSAEVASSSSSGKRSPNLLDRKVSPEPSESPAVSLTQIMSTEPKPTKKKLQTKVGGKFVKHRFY